MTIILLVSVPLISLKLLLALVIRYITSFVHTQIIIYIQNISYTLIYTAFTRQTDCDCIHTNTCQWRDIILHNRL